jgi:CelD/BcsL family acetyltransferase involved in cellulose biosynthesis
VPFLEHGWFTAWWKAFGEGRTLRVCIARRHGELAGALPLVARGSMLSSATNALTEMFEPLGDNDAARAVAAAAARDERGSLVLTHLPAGPRADLLVDEARRAGRVTWLESGQLSPFIDTTGNAQEYRLGLQRHARRELMRLRRKLESELDAVISPITAPDDLESQLQACLELEARGWKGRRGTAILNSHSSAAFYRAIVDAFARRGEVRISTVSARGRIVAFDLALMSSGRLWIPKGSYDETYRRYAPGLVLLFAQIERAFELGLQSVELLGGAEPYKRRFATGYRRLCTLHAHYRRPVPLARLSYRRAARPLLRSVYRRLRKR